MTSHPITFRQLGPEDAHVLDRVKDGTFDNPIDPARAWAFLALRVNDLVVALDRGEVIGFASGNVMMHPDKEPAYFIHEVSVHEDYRRQGIATRLMKKIASLAEDRGCQVIWLATEDDNGAARGLYTCLGGRETRGIVMYEWDNETGGI